MYNPIIAITSSFITDLHVCPYEQFTIVLGSLLNTTFNTIGLSNLKIYGSVYQKLPMQHRGHKNVYVVLWTSFNISLNCFQICIRSFYILLFLRKRLLCNSSVATTILFKENFVSFKYFLRTLYKHALFQFHTNIISPAMRFTVECVLNLLY